MGSTQLPGGLSPDFQGLRPGMRGGVIAVLILCAGLPYLPSLDSEFVLDDWAAVVHNPGAHAPLDLAAVFGRNYWGNLEGYEKLTIYRPLATLSFALTDMLADGDGPQAHRVLNVVLHILCTLLVFWIGLAVFRNRWAAAGVAAALFGVHPLHSEAVIGVVNRAELLAACFVLLGCVLWQRQQGRAGGRLRIWLPVIFALALLSKENGFTLWGVIIGWELTVWLSGRLKRGRWEKPAADLWLHGLMALVFGAYMLLRSQVLHGVLAGDLSPADNPMVGGDLVCRVLTPFKVFLWYVRLLLVPVGLTVDYSYRHFTVVFAVWDPEALAGLVLGLTVAVSVVVMAPRRMWWSLCAIGFLATYSVVSNMAFLSTIIMAERLLYLPSAWCLVLASGAGAMLLQGPGVARWKRTVAAVLVAALVLAYGAATVVRGEDWSTRLTLYSSAVETAPESAKSQHLLALELVRLGDDEGAVKHFSAAVAILPNYHVAETNYGRCLARLGRYDEALVRLRLALEAYPGYAPAVHVICGIFERTGKPSGAGKVCFPGSR